MSSIQELFSVQGRVAVIIGASVGIGLMAAEGLVKNGAKVYITGRREQKLKEAKMKLDAIRPAANNAEVEIFQMDVNKKDDIDNLVKFVEEREKSLDILINNAGAFAFEQQVNIHSSVEEMHAALSSCTASDWANVITTNAWAPYTVTSSFIPLLANAAKEGEGRGSVIMIGSMTSKTWNPWRTWTAYSVSKAALDHASVILAMKVHPLSIRINVVAPGAVPTEMSDPSIPFASSHESHVKHIPMKRAGNVDDISGIVIYLSSRASAYVNGQWIAVDGGLSLISNGLNET